MIKVSVYVEILKAIKYTIKKRLNYIFPVPVKNNKHFN